jgi:hypothetical protein
VLRQRAQYEETVRVAQRRAAEMEAKNKEQQERLDHFVKGSIDSMLTYRSVRARADQLEGERALRP